MSSFLFAQIPHKESRYVDSLKSIAGNKRLDDSLRSNASFALSGYLSDTDLKQAKQYFKEVTRPSKKHRYLMAVAPFPKSPIYPHYYATEAMYYDKVKRYKDASASTSRGLALATELKMEYMYSGLLLQQFHLLSCSAARMETRFSLPLRMMGADLI